MNKNQIILISRYDSFGGNHHHDIPAYTSLQKAMLQRHSRMADSFLVHASISVFLSLY